MGALSLRLPDDLEQRLNREAELAGRPRSEVIRDAVTQFIAQRERERFMAEYVAEAKAGYNDPALRGEALEIAEEAMPLDNEALDRAEGRKPDAAADPDSGENWWR
jgi:predicted transcriptional regulator